MAAHAIIIASDGKEALAPSTTQPCEYPRNPPNALKLPVHPPEATEDCNSLTEETKSIKPAEAGEQMKGAQCKGWCPPFEESVQGTQAVGRKIHAKAMEGGAHQEKRHEYEEKLCMKQAVSLSFDSTCEVSGEGGAQVISLIDNASWEVIDYCSGPA